MSLLAIKIIAYAIIGIFSGTIGGMLGLGGGILTVPCLFIMFTYLGYPQADVMHMAIGTSLAAMLFNTLASTWAQNKKGAVLWDVLRKMSVGLVLGSILGALTASSLSGIVLELFFGIFLCSLGIYFLCGKVRVKSQHKIPSLPLLNLLSTGVGFVSNILGIGGGTLTVPLLSSFHISDKSAIGTSSAATFLLAIMGSISYFIIGRNDPAMGQETGYINLTAFVVVGFFSFLLAPYGVKLAHELPTAIVRKIFAFVVIATGILMLFF